MEDNESGFLPRKPSSWQQENIFKIEGICKVKNLDAEIRHTFFFSGLFLICLEKWKIRNQEKLTGKENKLSKQSCKHLVLLTNITCQMTSDYFISYPTENEKSSTLVPLIPFFSAKLCVNFRQSNWETKETLIHGVFVTLLSVM